MGAGRWLLLPLLLVAARAQAAPPAQPPVVSPPLTAQTPPPVGDLGPLETRPAPASGAGAPTGGNGETVGRQNALTLPEVLASADRAYPLLLAALQRREVAAADVLSAEGGFDTSFRTRGSLIGIGYYDYLALDSVLEQPTTLWGASFFGGYRLGRGNIPPYYGNLETKPAGEVRAGVAVPLLRNGPIDKRRATIEQAELGRLVAEGDIDLFRIDMQRMAAYRYWDWVVAGQKLKIAQNLLQIAQIRDEAIRRRSELGDVAAIDRLDNERAIAERQERVVAAERALEQAAIALSLFVRNDEGLPVLVPSGRLPTGIPEPEERPHPDAIERALDRRPELRRIQALKKQNQVEVRLAKNQVLPALDLSLTGARDLGPETPERPYLNQTEVIGGVMFEVPLQRRAAKGRLQAAQAALTRLEAEEQMARDRIAADVRDALSALNAAAQRVELARQQRVLAVKLEQAERTRFDLGESNLLFVNLREQASANAALVEVDALATWLRAQADFRAAVGGVSEGEAPPAPPPPG